MAVKAGQPQVQCDKQVSTRTYVTTAMCLQKDMLQQVSNCCDERVNASTLKEKFAILGNALIRFLAES